MKLKRVNLHNTLVIGDVHSSLSNLKMLLDMTDYLHVDNYLFLGDIIDRGPDPNGTIEYIYSMKNKMIAMGNHDWKYVRYFGGNRKVQMKEEQQATLDALTSKSIELFKELFEEQVVGFWDPEMKVMLGHAAAARPLRIFEKTAIAQKKDINELFSLTEIDVSNKISSRFLYGKVDGSKIDENGFPVRLPITKSVFDNLDGWTFIHGHTHANEFYPEDNHNVICLDWSCGEPGGKLASLHITDCDSIHRRNLYITN